MGNHKVVWTDPGHPFGDHTVGQNLSELQQTLGGAVLKHPVAVFGNQLVKDAADGFAGKFFRIRPATGQGSYLGPGNQGTDVTDGRRLGI